MNSEKIEFKMFGKGASKSTTASLYLSFLLMVFLIYGAFYSIVNFGILGWIIGIVLLLLGAYMGIIFVFLAIFYILANAKFNFWIRTTEKVIKVGGRGGDGSEELEED